MINFTGKLQNSPDTILQKVIASYILFLLSRKYAWQQGGLWQAVMRIQANQSNKCQLF